MKHCPTCGSSYTDDTLVYCLQDGATLRPSSGQSNPLSMISTLRDDAQRADASSEGMDHTSAPTVEIPSSALPTSLYQEARPTAGPSSGAAAGGVGAAAAPPPSGASSSTTQSANTTRVIITTVAVTILLLSLGGISAWLFFRGNAAGGTGGAGREASTENSNSALPADSPGASNTYGTAQSNSQTRNDNRPDKGGRWFVILASFQKDELSRANERLEAVRRQGFDARMVSSDDYPNFKSGLWLVLMGPYTRNGAEELLEKVRPKIKDAYTKSGW